MLQRLREQHAAARPIMMLGVSWLETLPRVKGLPPVLQRLREQHAGGQADHDAGEAARVYGQAEQQNGD